MCVCVYVYNMKWYFFDIILYGHKLQKKTNIFILIYLDLCCHTLRDVNCQHSMIFT